MTWDEVKESFGKFIDHSMSVIPARVHLPLIHGDSRISVLVDLSARPEYPDSKINYKSEQ